MELVWEEVFGCSELDSFLPNVDYLEREIIVLLRIRRLLWLKSLRFSLVLCMIGLGHGVFLLPLQ